MANWFVNNKMIQQMKDIRLNIKLLKFSKAFLIKATKMNVAKKYKKRKFILDTFKYIRDKISITLSMGKNFE